ncbi:MAG TPA: YezD family protein [Desulfitobacteriaceae bacterium]|jgi:hypothetical protein|nr:YezD family protein [Desulfitobacteriaceae bacterium]
MIEKIRTIPCKREVLNQEEIRKLLEIIRTVSYGSVTLIIREGIITQIDKNEKIRLRKKLVNQ